jgi:hypothetical protein
MPKKGNQNHKMGDFAKHPHKEDAMRALQNGRSIADVAKDFGISERTVYRYSNQLINYTPLPEPVKPEHLIDNNQKEFTRYDNSEQEGHKEEPDFDNIDDGLTDNSQEYMTVTSEKTEEIIPEFEAKEEGKMYSSKAREEIPDNTDEDIRTILPEVITTPVQINEGGITLSITLPPVVLTLFDFAKAAELLKEDTDLDKWLFECVHKRFELDYKLQLALVPVDGEER